MGHQSNQLLKDRINSLPRPVRRWPRWIVAGGGPGFLRPAPGSWGTVPPAALLWGMLIAGMGETLRAGILLAMALVVGALLIALGKWAAAYYQQPDPGTCVLDEYAGFAVAAIFVPVPTWCSNHGIWGLFVFTAAIYLLFRATDTLKIPPVNWLERLPWGWGVLLDDLAAGLQANLIAQVIVRLWLV